MIERFKSSYLYICWLPLAIYLLSDFYIATFEGWGQWAMAVVVLPNMLLSAMFFMAGLVMVTHCLREKLPCIALAVGTLLAGSVFLGFVGRSILVSYALL